jgi:hypothetical protein
MPALARALPSFPRSTIYNMCTQKPPYDYSEQLYNRYREAFNTYIHDKVRRAAAAGPQGGQCSSARRMGRAARRRPPPCVP